MRTDRLTVSRYPPYLATVEWEAGRIPTNIVSNRIPVAIATMDLPVPGWRGGALASDGNTVIVADRDTALYLREENGFRALDLPRAADLEDQRFRIGRDKRKAALGTRGLALRRVGNAMEIYLSHGHYDAAGECFDLRVSRLTVPMAVLADPAQAFSGTWAEIYRADPCLDRERRVATTGGGGAMAFLGGDRLLVSVGHFGALFETDLSDIPIPLDPAFPYGKSLVIDLSDRAVTGFTMGHRNISGLAVVPGGRIFSVEHGPRGGDELNVLEAGLSYGFPLKTLGTTYGRFEWQVPDAALTGPARQDFTGPFLAWVPSVAPSDVALYRGTEFAAWQGDLLVTTLRGQRLLRVRPGRDGVTFVEPLYLNDRLRGITVDEDGEVFVLSDSRPVVYRLFRQNPDVDGEAIPEGAVFCAECHRTVPGQADPGIAPSLVGIVGRAVAADPEFAYSDALRRVGGVWDVNRIVSYISDVQGFAPGSTMPQIAMSGSDVARTVNLLRRRD